METLLIDFPDVEEILPEVKQIRIKNQWFDYIIETLNSPMELYKGDGKYLEKKKMSSRIVLKSSSMKKQPEDFYIHKKVFNTKKLTENEVLILNREIKNARKLEKERERLDGM